MSLMEKVAYLKGLADGLGFDPEANEGKLFFGIIDMISAMSKEIDTLSDNTQDISEELDALSDSLADVEEYLLIGGYEFDDDDDDNDFDFDFGSFSDIDLDDDDECDCEHCQGHDFSLEVECPSCGANIMLNDDSLTSGSATCLACGEVFELEFDDVEDSDEEAD